MQRLVARVMLEPRAADAEAEIIVVGLPVCAELQNAAQVIQLQTKCGAVRENDEYAFGDLSIVLLLLGTDGWRGEMKKFRAIPNADYAINGTREVLSDILTVSITPTATSDRLTADLNEALQILT